MVRWSEAEYEMHQMKRRPAKSKYRNVKTEVDGVVFDSKREAARWTELRAMEKAGEISDLRRQVPFALVVNRKLICNYKADFTYRRDGKEVVEDVKSAHTRTLPEYRLKKKLMDAVYGVEIVET